MPRWLPLIAAVLMLSAWAVPQSIGTATVHHGGNLRSEPRIVPATVLGQICPKDTLTLLERRQSWYRVRVAKTPQSCAPARVTVGTEGWLSASLITLTTSSAPAAPAPTAAPPARVAPAKCDPSYPTLCIAPGAPDLDCPDIPSRNFPVLPPDPHRFDGDKDGIGCES